MKNTVLYRALRSIYHKSPFYKKPAIQVKKGLNKEDFYHEITKYDIISFDIFDTLVTRCLYEPDDLFQIMAEKLKDEEFVLKRKNAEREARNQYKHDVNLKEIYQSYQKLYSCKESEVKKIKQLEMDLELHFIVPRKEMLEVFEQLIQEKKYVILTSDMYLEKEWIIKMLSKCGYQNYKKLYLSNEIHKRKDQKDIWPYLLKQHKGKSIVHIGDNHFSDYLYPMEFGIHAIEIESSKKLLEKSPMYPKIQAYIENRTMSDSISMGLLFNKTIFNSPFSDLQIHNLNDFAYAFHGPVLNEYLKFICENTKDHFLLFLAREGYYLQKLYQFYVKKYHIKEEENCYFLTSRKSTSLSSISTSKELLDLAKNEYDGSIKNFFKNNLEIEYEEEDFPITLPKEQEKMTEILIQYQSKILEEAKKERENYKKYFESVVENYMDQDIVLIDLGYSGSIQYNLTRMLKKDFKGIYLTNSEKVKKYNEKSELLFTFDNRVNPNYIKLYHYSLILEYFLTAPTGQLQRFEMVDSTLKPVFNDEKLTSSKKACIEEIYKSVKEYINDVAHMNSIYPLSMNKDLICTVYTSLIEDYFLHPSIKDQFNYVDAFCRDEEKNVFKVISKY